MALTSAADSGLGASTLERPSCRTSAPGACSCQWRPWPELTDLQMLLAKLRREVVNYTSTEAVPRRGYSGLTFRSLACLPPEFVQCWAQHPQVLDPLDGDDSAGRWLGQPRSLLRKATLCQPVQAFECGCRYLLLLMLGVHSLFGHQEQPQPLMSATISTAPGRTFAGRERPGRTASAISAGPESVRHPRLHEDMGLRFEWLYGL